MIRVIVIRTAGTNCDLEMVHAFELAGARVDRVHVRRLVRKEVRLDDFQIVAIPGGFTYGDDIAGGKILANELQAHVGEDLRRFVDSGKLLLGVCNGFQVLVKMGFLPGGGQAATLATNDSNRFEDRWVYIKAETDRTPFIGKGEVIALPVAHAEGKFIVRTREELQRLKDQDRIVFRYVDAEGQPGPYPVNPNGSQGDVAGICDETGRVMGLMPHPERHIYPHHHPRWTRLPKKEGDGLRIFRNAIRNLS
ncbi:MAG: phosphoribosylformylglycinamidine synthase I [Planctomycetota bacterium]|nr:phosphoribosylformylglycinamidine synthase I [Planctomycetota bacterium]